MHAARHAGRSMNLPDLETFWSLVADSRLVEPDALPRLREACEAGDTVEAAKWLVGRGMLSTWQARRLARGDRGPYFIGGYRLMARLEAAGPGLLFRARHDASGRRVQLRLLDRAASKQQEVWTGIVRRITVAHGVRHPLLSRTTALEKEGSHRFIVCEDIPLTTLAEALEERGGMPVDAAGRIALEVAQAVAELHRLGDVHGAITSDALRLEPVPATADPRTGRVRLAQFPLAGDPHLQPPRLPVESADAMEKLGRGACFVAPELTNAGVPCDSRTDVYALGCLVHALVSGAPPGWQGDAHRTLVTAAAADMPPLPPPASSHPLAPVVATMTARDPRSRYPSAVEAADAIAACLGLPPVSASPPPAPVSQRPAVAGAASAVLSTSPNSASVTVSPAPFAEPTGAVPVIDTGRSSRRPTKAAARHGHRAPARGRGGRARGSIWVATGLLAVAAVGAVTTIVVLTRPSATQPPVQLPPDDAAIATAKDPAPSLAAPGKSAQGATKGEPSGGADSQSPAVAVLVDDPGLPWASPTGGRPPPLAYLPPGSQLILVARLAEIAASADGGLFLEALGPQVGQAVALLQQVCGCGLDGIEELQAGWQAGGPGEVVAGYAIRLRAPADEAAVASRIAGGRATIHGSETLHVGEGITLWMPSAEQRRMIVCGNEQLVRAIVDAESKAGPVGDGTQLRAVMPRDMELLVGMLDRSRHATLLGSPHALRTEARDMLTGPLAPLVEPLGDFFGESVRAAALSIHFGDSFYVEMDAVETVDEPARVMAKSLRQKIDTMAGAVEDWTAGLDGARYGRKLINRLPVMVKFLAAHARAGAEGTRVVLNAYLPRHAGHNLALATELALAQANGAGAAVGAAPRPAAEASGGARKKLQKKTSLSFKSDTLERSIQLLEEDIGMRIEILGGDLKLEGITKNQSFSLNEKDKPAEEILRAILLKANPDGKLVYVFRGTGDGDSIVITTRAQVAERGDPLPPVFESPPAKQE